MADRVPDVPPPDSLLLPGNAPALGRGAALGRYILLELIGRGGMGVVYAAYDPELDRKLAIKLHPLGEASGDEQARLLREGQATARLSHPNVVTVYDVGTFDDGVFVALELVQGESLRSWLEARGRGWREILATFVQAGRGLSAAHAAGIVHRDFKPDNVVVGVDGRARVVDFGLARSTGGAESAGGGAGARGDVDGSADASIGEHSRIVGTPRYMSPEQLGGQKVDARADQFAFCVSLWEALYGAPPFQGQSLIALAANIREKKITAPPGDAAPGWIRPLLERGLAPSPEERFTSMEELLAALARDPAAARRRWLGWGAAAAAVSLAVAGTRAVEARRGPACPSAEPELAGVWDDGARDAVARAFRATKMPFAEDALRGVAPALDAYAAAWVHMHGEACEATRLRGVQSPELMDLRMACLGERLTRLRALAAQLRTADGHVVEEAVRAVAALPTLEECADATALRAPVRLPADSAVRARVDEVRGGVAQAGALAQAGRLPEAVTVAQQAVSGAKATGYAPLEAEALETYGEVLDAHLEEARAAEVLNDAILAAVRGRHEVVEARAWVALAHAAAVDRADARGRDAVRHAQAALERSPDPDRADRLAISSALIAQDENKLGEARAILERVARSQEERLPPDHPDLAVTLRALGNALYAQGHYDEALAVQRRVLAIAEKAFGPSHPLAAQAHVAIGNPLLQKGDYDAAVAEYRRAIELRVAVYGEDSPLVADACSNLGLAFTWAHRYDEAAAAQGRALAIREKVLPPDHQDLVDSLMNEAELANWRARWAEAIGYARRAAEILERTQGPASSRLVSAFSLLGEPLIRLGRAPEALPLLERSVAIADANDGEPILRASAQHVLALALRATGRDPARARALAASARAVFAAEPAANADLIAEIDEEFPGPAPR